MNHIVLLGDSIFDNGSYVHQDRGEEPVLDQMRGLLPGGWDVTLAARDGDRIRDVCRQLDGAPADASHRVVSVGGNDALAQSNILIEPAGSVGEALMTLARTREQFRREYREMLETVVAFDKATVVCTIYDRFSLGAEWSLIADQDGVVQAAVAMFNDLIIGEAVRARVPVLDLRRICDDRRDYSDIFPIEPSAAGSAKIARAVWRVVADHDFRRRQTVVFGKEVLAPQTEIATPFGVLKRLVGESREEWFTPEGWAEDRDDPIEHSWPIAPLSAEWIWGEEPDPQLGDIVGWSWERQQVAVVTDVAYQSSEPSLDVELRPMPEEWQRARVLEFETGKEHKSVLWYERWNREGVKRADGARLPFEGRCTVIV